MSVGKVKAAKLKVHLPPENVTADAHFHVYVYDVFNQAFLPGKVFDTAEKAAAFQRHEQERIYTEQEADPELFELPFISHDPDLIGRIASDGEYRARLVRDLSSDARARARRH